MNLIVKEGPPAADPAQPALPNLTDVIAGHEQWLATQGRNGARAVLARRNLTGADLRQVDLRKADMSGVILRSANLRSTNLSGANLHDAILDAADAREADFTGADLGHASLVATDLRQAQLSKSLLRDADLTSADLSTTTGLLPGQLGGTILASAHLPDHMKAFEGLANVAEASKTTQNLFTTIILVCAYTWLTVASTTDAQLLNNAAPPSSRMPILGIDIPLVRFYMVAPLLLFCLYVYFHLCLQRLWEELSDLPAIFPDGRPLDRKAYPWLMNGLVRAHAPRLRDHRSYLSRWQTRMSTLLAWGLCPLTLLVLWCRYLRAHDWIVSGLHIGLLSVSIGVGFGFLKLAGSTLRGSEWFPFMWRRAWYSARAFMIGVSVAAAAVLTFASFGVIDGVNPNVVWSEQLARQLLSRYSRLDPRRWAPASLERIGLSPSAVLDDAVLSTKPSNWVPEDPALDSVRGADLENRSLRYARAYNAFFVNAYMHYADLRYADFREADMRRADLRETRLTGTNFRNTRLESTDFRKADMTETRLFKARCDQARLSGAKLVNANLEEAQLRGADLTDADLTGAKLAKSKMEPSATNPAKPSVPTLLVNAKLTNADLSGADLTGANLTNANLTGANLTGTILKDAILEGAKTSGAIGLTKDQLKSARNADPTPSGFAFAQTH